MLPRADRPGLVTGFTGAGNRVETPSFAPRLRIVGGDEPSNAELSTSHAHDDFVLDYQRRQRHRISRTRVRDLRIPQRPARFGVEGNQVSVERCQKQRVAKDRQHAIDRPPILKLCAPWAMLRFSLNSYWL